MCRALGLYDMKDDRSRTNWVACGTSTCSPTILRMCEKQGMTMYGAAVAPP
jgi:hypothetical protein